MRPRPRREQSVRSSVFKCHEVGSLCLNRDEPRHFPLLLSSIVRDHRRVKKTHTIMVRRFGKMVSQMNRLNVGFSITLDHSLDMCILL